MVDGNMGSMEMAGKGKVCNCPHHKMIPLLIVLFALLFLLGNLGILSYQIVDIGWPIIVGLAGLQKLAAGKCKCC